jgi:beta-1,4-mannosyl-glycoprotein beta-1,4-N-acetylglucosaminyltransferase
MNIKNTSRFKVFDCFTFFNEFNLLKTRLEELDDIVDYFVICEGKYTFTGKEKPLYFKENKDKFKKYENKIIHLIDYEMPLDSLSPWIREEHQRNFLNNGLKKFKLNENDQILISDIDEIPSKKTLKKILPVNWIFSLQQDFYYYNLYTISTVKWRKAKIINYKTYLSKYNCKPHDVRNERDFRRIYNKIFYRNVIRNGGWHFSFFGDEFNIINKIENFSHSEFNQEKFKKVDHIKDSINEGLDIFERKNMKFKKLKNLNYSKLPKSVNYLT